MPLCKHKIKTLQWHIPESTYIAETPLSFKKTIEDRQTAEN